MLWYHGESLQENLICHLKMSMKMIRRQSVLKIKLKNKVLRLEPFPKFFDIDKKMIILLNYFSEQVKLFVN